MAILTEEEFSKHIGTEFYVKAGEDEAKLTLAEVKGYSAQPMDDKSLERFSLFFVGPADSLLSQKVFQVRHETMGEFDIFLVPIKSDAKGVRYEAVFNYFKQQ
jgi:hypothetical protein